VNRERCQIKSGIGLGAQIYVRELRMQVLSFKKKLGVKPCAVSIKTLFFAAA
jgi:hypothetical protein